jgi:hypothetical protein
MPSWVIQDQDNKAAELLQQHWVGGGCYMIPKITGVEDWINPKAASAEGR